MRRDAIDVGEAGVSLRVVQEGAGVDSKTMVGWTILSHTGYAIGGIISRHEWREAFTRRARQKEKKRRRPYPPYLSAIGLRVGFFF